MDPRLTKPEEKPSPALLFGPGRKWFKVDQEEEAREHGRVCGLHVFACVVAGERFGFWVATRCLPPNYPIWFEELE